MFLDDAAVSEVAEDATVSAVPEGEFDCEDGSTFLHADAIKTYKMHQIMIIAFFNFLTPFVLYRVILLSL